MRRAFLGAIPYMCVNRSIERSALSNANSHTASAKLADSLIAITAGSSTLALLARKEEFLVLDGK